MLCVWLPMPTTSSISKGLWDLQMSSVGSCTVWWSRAGLLWLSELYFTQFRIQTKLYANEKVPNLRIDDFQPSPLLLIFSVIELNFRIALVCHMGLNCQSKSPTSRYRSSAFISCYYRYNTSRDGNIKNRTKRKKSLQCNWFKNQFYDEIAVFFSQFFLVRYCRVVRAFAWPLSSFSYSPLGTFFKCFCELAVYLFIHDVCI